MNEKPIERETESRPEDAQASEQVKAVRCCYSVSLVFRETFLKENGVMRENSVLRTMVITEPCNSKDEALGMALHEHKDSVRKMGDYMLHLWDIVEFPPNNCI